MRSTFWLSATLALAVPSVALTACGDEVTDPDALVESAEADAVMRSAAALPFLPELADRAQVEGADQAALFRARELWDEGTAATDARGRVRRRLAISYAAPILAIALDTTEWTIARKRVDAWMSTADAMLRHISLPAVDQRLQAARTLLSRADASPGVSRRAYYLMLATSELVETTPGYLARTMAADAADAVRRSEARRPEGRGGEATLARARRLKDWAARAVEEGDYLLAIQRAYYAIELANSR